jgi:hypothetical protein
VSYWGVHVGFAGITTALVLLVLAPGHRYRWPLIGASGLWAVVPDFHHALDAFPAAQATWKAVLHDSVVAELFWLHRWIDRADPGDSVPLSLAMWTAFVVVLVVTETLVRRRGRRERTTTEA